MADLQSRDDHLQQENDRLRASVEGERLESARVRKGGGGGGGAQGAYPAKQQRHISGR